MADKDLLFMDQNKLDKLIELGIYSKDMVNKVRGISVPSLTSTSTASSSAATQSSNATSDESRDKSDDKKSYIRELENRSRNSTKFGPFQKRVAHRNRTPSPLRKFRNFEKDNETLEEEERKRKEETIRRREEYMERKKKESVVNDSNSEDNPQNKGINDSDFRFNDRDYDNNTRIRDSDNKFNDALNYNKSNIPSQFNRASDNRFNRSPNYNKPKDMPPFNRSDDTPDEDFRSSTAKKSRFDELRDERPAEDRRSNYDFKTSRSNFFDDNRNKCAPQPDNNTITDIDLFIKQCSNKEDKEEKNPLKMISDDFDDFIKQATMKLTTKGKPNAQRRPPIDPTKQNQNNRQNRNNLNDRNVRSVMASSRLENNDFSRKTASIERNRDNFRETSNMSSNMESNSDPNKHIDILKDTVKELSQSNLYCEFCKCNLSSLAEVNTHIGTVLHQQNMAKHELSLTKSYEDNTDFSNANQTVVPKLTGMAFLMDIIAKRQDITLSLLTNMNSYEINSEEEATAAKELAQLLTSELLKYKMTLMPTV